MEYAILSALYATLTATLLEPVSPASKASNSMETPAREPQHQTVPNTIPMEYAVNVRTDTTW